jgi:hypothetical protein
MFSLRPGGGLRCSRWSCRPRTTLRRALPDGVPPRGAIQGDQCVFTHNTDPDGQTATHCGQTTGPTGQTVCLWNRGPRPCFGYTRMCSCNNGETFGVNTSKFQRLVFHAIKIPIDRWHCRLGQPSRDIIRRVVSKNNLPCANFVPSSSSVCDACACAKAHQLPYSLSSSTSSAPSQLIHSDVWGHAIESFGRKWYYISFINDHSKITWIYLLRHKSEALKYFLEFHALVEHMFNHKIISIQFNWGGEYEHLISFFHKIGITHQVSCPHTHQQNGVAERKHRHIVEMGLALIAHASMPLKYWDESFLVAVYLINCTPMRLLSYDTSLHQLLGATPDYSSFCVFGCACWPNLCPYNF